MHLAIPKTNAKNDSLLVEKREIAIENARLQDIIDDKKHEVDHKE